MKRRRWFPANSSVCQLIATNLSASITWPNDATQSNNIIYSMVLTMTGLIWADNVVATVTLPAGISFISAVDGTHSSQVITRTIGELIWGYSRQFVINWATLWTYTLNVAVTTTTANGGTATNTKAITIIAESEPIVGCPDPSANNYVEWADDNDEFNRSLCEY